MRTAIIGDSSDYESASTAFRDLVRESNRGEWLWFVPSINDFERWLDSVDRGAAPSL